VLDNIYLIDPPKTNITFSYYYIVLTTIVIVIHLRKFIILKLQKQLNNLSFIVFRGLLKLTNFNHRFPETATIFVVNVTEIVFANLFNLFIFNILEYLKDKIYLFI
jgi:hypothetical protein